MEAKAQLKLFKEQLDKELKGYLDIKIEEAAKISPFAKELAEHIADLTLRGGKRIRAALFYYSYLGHGGKNKLEALRASMSMELSETYLLIHDDIMDNDSLRRGGMTINTSYRQIGENRYHDRINTRNFGNSIAMMAGDIACAMSNEILTEAKFKPQFINEAVRVLNKIYATEGYGQVLDLLSVLRDDIAQKDVILVHQLKTVPYTFDGPVRIGAILAGANKKELEHLSNYTVPLGTAFQIQDDVLGMFGSEEKLGKPVISDLKEGKKTLLILEALLKAKGRDRETIIINLGNRKTTLNALKDVREVIEKTGSLAHSKRLAQRYVREAMQSMDKMSLRKDGKDFLIGIAEYMINRDY